MRLSKTLVPTLKEAPAEAEVPSHVFMVRGGYLRKVAAGVYSFLPLGWRVIQKIQRIIREEMNRAGASEVFLPAVVPAELWQESGRWDKYGAQLLRFKDRKGGDFVIGADARGGHRRSGARRRAQLSPAPAEPVSDPDQVPGRAAPAGRAHARARVHHEGRVLVPCRPEGRRARVPGDVRGVRENLHALRAGVPRRRGRHRRHRRLDVARVPGARPRPARTSWSPATSATTPPTSSRPPTGSATWRTVRCRPATEPMTKVATPGKGTHRGRLGVPEAAADAVREDADLPGGRQAGGGPGARRSSGERDQAEGGARRRRAGDGWRGRRPGGHGRAGRLRRAAWV